MKRDYVVLGCCNCPFLVQLGLGRWCVHPATDTTSDRGLKPLLNDKFSICHLDEDDPPWCEMREERELHLLYENPNCDGIDDDGSGLCSNTNCETCYPLEEEEE